MGGLGGKSFHGSVSVVKDTKEERHSIVNSNKIQTLFYNINTLCDYKNCAVDNSEHHLVKAIKEGFIKDSKLYLLNLLILCISF